MLEQKKQYEKLSMALIENIYRVVKTSITCYYGKNDSSMHMVTNIPLCHCHDNIKCLN